MQTFTMIIHGDEIQPADVVAMARQFAGKYEQEIIHKDKGPDRNGVYDETFLDRPFSVVWGVGQPAGTIITQAEDASGNGMTADSKLPATSVNDPDPDTVEIPEGWRNLDWPALRSLGASLSPAPVKTADDAVAAIEAELARRAAKQEPSPDAA